MAVDRVLRLDHVKVETAVICRGVRNPTTDVVQSDAHRAAQVASYAVIQFMRALVRALTGRKACRPISHVRFHN